VKALEKSYAADKRGWTQIIQVVAKSLIFTFWVMMETTVTSYSIRVYQRVSAAKRRF
jgi:hypothetical protein